MHLDMAVAYFEMMKRSITVVLAFLTMAGFTQPESGRSERISSIDQPHRFNLGEEFDFRLSYGWFTVGKAELKLEDEIANFNEKDCYKVDISGRTAGFVGVFTKVEDSWGGYVETDQLLPVMAYSDISEGKYMRKEQVIFDQDNGLIRVDMIKKHKKRPTKYYEFEDQMNDMISGYLRIRNTNFGQLNLGDTVRFPAYYDEEFYDFGLIYQGLEEIRTKLGRLSAHRLKPILPENKIFPGDDPISVWISADRNQLPLKVEARMYFGNASCELVGYKNVKYGPDFE